MFLLSDISKKLKNNQNVEVEILKAINLKIEPHEIFGIIGSSGAGKSSLLRVFNLLLRPDQGKVFLEGTELTSLSQDKLRYHRHKIGMIFQHFNLLSNKTVYENIAFALKASEVPKEKHNELITKALNLVKLSEKKLSYPNQLSGGQKQRVAIARAIANNPNLLLADEPTSALDPVTKVEIVQYLKELNKNLGLTIILATHEMDIVKAICHRVAVIHDGQIVEIVPIENGEANPQTEAAKRILNQGKL